MLFSPSPSMEGLFYIQIFNFFSLNKPHYSYYIDKV